MTAEDRFAGTLKVLDALVRTGRGERLRPEVVAAAVVGGAPRSAEMLEWSSSREEVVTAVRECLAEGNQDRMDVVARYVASAGLLDETADLIPLDAVTNGKVQIVGLPGLNALLAGKLGDRSGAWEALETFAESWTGGVGDLAEAALLVSQGDSRTWSPADLRVRRGKRVVPGPRFEQLCRTILAEEGGPGPEVVRALQASGARRNDEVLVRMVVERARDMPQDVWEACLESQSVAVRVACVWSPSLTAAESSQLFPDDTRASVTRSRALRARVAG